MVVRGHRRTGCTAQLNAFDSAFLFDVRQDYSNPANQPVRILALGRDPSATIDSGLARHRPASRTRATTRSPASTSPTATPPSNGLLGAKLPRPFQDGWRVFYTQQHGDNVTWEIIPAERQDAQ